MTKEIVTVERRSLFFDVELFEHAQRVATMLAKSTMVPEHFRNNIGNCVIALNYAERVGLDPFMVMQKMYVIHGKPAIETQLQIALFNKNERFTSLRFVMDENKTSCVAYATELLTDEKLMGPECSIAIAKKEGWYDKKGSKWQTMPELMLRYRAAAFFIRLYAPETVMGLQSTEEMTDIIDITPHENIETEIKENANTETIDIAPEQPEPEPVQDQSQEPEAEAKQQSKTAPF